METFSSGQSRDPFAFPWSSVRYEHAELLKRLLLETGRAAPTVNLYLAGLRGVLRHAWKLGQMSAEDYHLAASVESVRGFRPPAGRHLETKELARLLEHCATDPVPARGARNAALLALLFGAGLRRVEATALDVAHLGADGELEVAGKGGKVRRVPLGPGPLETLRAWIDTRGREPGPLLWPVSRQGTPWAHRLTVGALNRALERLGRSAGIARFSPHDLRRTYVGELLDAGADLSTVQRLVGHASVNQTQRYDRRPARVAQEAARKVPFPVCDHQSALSSGSGTSPENRSTSPPSREPPPGSPSA